MNGPTHDPLNPITIPTALDRAAEAERMAHEVKAEPDHRRKVELALKLVDFILRECDSPEQLT